MPIDDFFAQIDQTPVTNSPAQLSGQDFFNTIDGVSAEVSAKRKTINDEQTRPLRREDLPMLPDPVTVIKDTAKDIAEGLGRAAELAPTAYKEYKANPWKFIHSQAEAAKPAPAKAWGQVESMTGGFARLLGFEDFANEMAENVKAVEAQIQSESPVDQGSVAAATRGALTSVYANAPALLSGVGLRLLTKRAAMPVIKKAALSYMSAQAAGQTLESQLTSEINPATKTKAMGMAAINAAAEVIPEMFSWNILFSKGPSVGKKAFKYYASEVLGENATASVNLAVDKMTINPNMSIEDVKQAYKATTAQTLIASTIMQVPNIAMHYVPQPIQFTDRDVNKIETGSFVDQLKQAYPKLNISFVNTLSDIPHADVMERVPIEIQGKIRGYAYGDSDVVLIKDQHTDNKDLLTTFAHETFGHLGTRQFVPTSLLQRVAQSFPVRIEQLKSDLQIDDLSAAEELIAENTSLIEYQEPVLFNEIKSSIKLGLAKRGLNIELDDNDVNKIVRNNIKKFKLPTFDAPMQGEDAEPEEVDPEAVKLAETALNDTFIDTPRPEDNADDFAILTEASKDKNDSAETPTESAKVVVEDEEVLPEGVIEQEGLKEITPVSESSELSVESFGDKYAVRLGTGENSILVQTGITKEQAHTYITDIKEGTVTQVTPATTFSKSLNHGTDDFSSILSILETGLRPGTSVASGTGWSPEYPIQIEFETTSTPLQMVQHHPDHALLGDQPQRIKSITIDTSQMIDTPNEKEIEDKVDKLMTQLSFKYQQPNDGSIYEWLDANKDDAERPANEVRRDLKQLDNLLDDLNKAIETSSNKKVSWEMHTQDIIKKAKELKIPVHILGDTKNQFSTTSSKPKGKIETINAIHKSSNLESLQNGFEDRIDKGYGISVARTPEEVLSSPTAAEPKGTKGLVNIVVSGTGLDYKNPEERAYIDDIWQQQSDEVDAGTRQMINVAKVLKEQGFDFVHNWNSIGEASELHVLNNKAIKIIPKPTESIIPIENVQESHVNSVAASEDGNFRLVLNAPEGSAATPENVKKIIIDPDGFLPEEMISSIRNNIAELSKQYPKATFEVVDSREEGSEPKLIFKAKKIGNANLTKIKKHFGATEDINPRSRRASISPEEKVARLILKDPKTVKDLAKNNPEMLAKLSKDAGRKTGTLTNTVKTLPSDTPKIQQNVWYKGFKDGDSVVSRDRSKIEAQLGAGAEIVSGKMDGTNFIPDETVVKEKGVIEKLVEKMPPIGLSTKVIGGPFYSQLENIVEEKMPSKMPVKSLFGMLQGKVSEDELTNLLGEFKGREGTVTKGEVQEAIKANRTELEDVVLGEGKIKRTPDGFAVEDSSTGEFLENNQTQFSSYQLPGAVPESYREMFVTAPSINEKQITDSAYTIDELLQQRNAGLITAAEYNAAFRRSVLDISKDWQDGHSAYSNIQNPVVRIRFNERTIPGEPDNDRSWAYGKKLEKKYQGFTAFGETPHWYDQATPAERAKFDALANEQKRILFIEEMQGPSPSEQKKMPTYLKKRIYDIGVKRVLAYAKENGFDGVGWTTGEQQAERYDLSKHVRKIQYKKAGEGTYFIIATGISGDNVMSQTATKEDLPNVVGKEIANKIISGEGETSAFDVYTTLSGLDLKVGGEGLKDTYDKRIPSLMGKYGKEQLNSMSLRPESGPQMQEAMSAEMERLRNAGHTGRFHEIAIDARANLTAQSSVPYIPITERTPFSFPIGLSTQTPEQLLAIAKAKANLAETAIRLWRKAGGTDIKEFAAQQGYTPEQLAMMKDALNYFVSNQEEKKVTGQNKKNVKLLSNIQKAHILQKELDMSNEDFEAFKILVTGKPSMSKKAADPMNAAERKAVVERLSELYEEKFKESYKFQRKTEEQLESEAEIKGIVGHVEKDYSTPELLSYGIRQMIASRESWLNRTPTGRMFAKLINKVLTSSTIDTGRLLEELRPYSKYIHKNNDRLVTLITEAEKNGTTWTELLNSVSGIDKTVLNGYRTIMNTVQQMAVNADMKVVEVLGKNKTVEHAFPNDPEKVYFPHMLVDKSEELSEQYRKQAILNLMKPTARFPDGRTQLQAAKLFKDILESKKGMTRDPYLEYQRQYDVEGFNKNLLEVTTIYTAKAMKRLYTVMYFGKDQKKIDSLITKHANEGGNLQIAKYVAQNALGTGVMEADGELRKLAELAIGYEVISKMGPFSALSQLGQFQFVFEETNLKIIGRTISRLLRNSTREEAMHFGYSSGAVTHSLMKEFLDYVKGNDLVDSYLKYAGFTPLDRGARIFAAVAGREYVRDLYHRVQSNPNDKGSKRRLKQFGIDADYHLTNNVGLTEDELYFAGLRMSEMTQYRSGAMTLPPLVTNTPICRMITLFHQFSYHRARTLVNRFNENPEFFARRFIPSLIGATAFGALGSELRRLITGKERPDKWWKLWFEYLVMGAWFGMANDALQAMFRSAEGAAAYIAGPVIGDAAKIGFDAFNAAKGNPRGLAKDALNAATYGATVVNPILGVGMGVGAKAIGGRLLTKEQSEGRSRSRGERR